MKTRLIRYALQGRRHLRRGSEYREADILNRWYGALQMSGRCFWVASRASRPAGGEGAELSTAGEQTLSQQLGESRRFPIVGLWIIGPF